MGNVNRQSACGQGARRWAVVGLCLALLQGLAGCVNLRPLGPEGAGAGRYGSWVELDEARMVEVAPGVRLELSASPYRARFEDADGVYYQAAGPLVFRTQHGIVNAVQGGLYVRHDNPQEARTWAYPELGAPHTPNPRPIKVRMFKPA